MHACRDGLVPWALILVSVCEQCLWLVSLLVGVVCADMYDVDREHVRTQSMHASTSLNPEACRALHVHSLP